MRKIARASSEGAVAVGLSRSGMSRSGKIGVSGQDREGHGRANGHRQVAELQRARMLTAMVQEISERGAANVSVAHVVGRSGVSRRTFYELFEDREDCFLAAFGEALKQVAAVVVPAYEGEVSWRARIRAGLVVLLQCLDRDPSIGRLLVVESLASGHRALERRQSVLAQIVSIVEEGRIRTGTSTEVKTVSDPPPLTAEGIVGGVLSVLHARLTEENPGSLVGLTGPLMGMIVLPYLGPAAARKEIERPTPKQPAKQTVVRNDPLQDLPMRFTYRTIRVLTSIAELSAQGTYPSNRAVGEHAGIPDQGQASKLLARLHKLGLIQNHGGDPTRGEPNAWVLTATGREVHDSIAGLTG